MHTAPEVAVDCKLLILQENRERDFVSGFAMQSDSKGRVAISGGNTTFLSCSCPSHCFRLVQRS